MTLNELFKNTNYNDALFSKEACRVIEDAIFLKNIKGKDIPYITCISRKKEVKLTPEEAVRQLYLYKLIHDYHYPESRIELEAPIHFGREIRRADIIITDKDRPMVPYIIVELKKPKLANGKAQLKSYCNATGAPIGVWTNGGQVSYYNRKNPNLFEAISDIPKATQKLSDIVDEHRDYAWLVAHDKISHEKRSLRSLIKEMEDEVLASAGVDSFEEIFKLIFSKLYDELICANDASTYLKFRNNGNTDFELKEKIQSLFDDAKKRWEGVFADESKILLSPSHLAVCVSTLQDIKLFNNNLDVVDDAFEYLMSKAQKGEKGQYFTPRYVIDMCVKMMNPSDTDKIIDTACGSSGFTVHSIFKVWKDIRRKKGLPEGEGFTAAQRISGETDFVRNNVFAIDFDEKTVRVARTLNLIAGDGQTNVLHLNTLDYSRWGEIIKQKAWKETYYEGFEKLEKMQMKGVNDYSQFQFDLVMANPPFAGDIKENAIISRYELGKNSAGKWQNKVGRDVLFIERNLNFLRPGGRMAIVLPQGRFSNSSDKVIREFIAERCRILAVVGLHGNVFKPHTNTKTSVLFVQKWDEKLCPKRNDYPIFFATMQKPGKDNSGRKIYLKEPETGENALDKHGHLIVDHDLYQLSYKKQDGTIITLESGIAEAFAEFAKKRRAKFFPISPFMEPFDDSKYKELMDGLECSEITLRNLERTVRIDAEFYKKENLNIVEKLKRTSFYPFTEFFTVSDGNHMSISENFIQDGVPYYRGQDIYHVFIEEADPVCIDEKIYEHPQMQRSHLHARDVLMSIVGAIVGNSAIVSANKKATCSCKLAIMRAKNNGILPEVLLVYIKTKYGQNQIQKFKRGTAQTGLLLEDFDQLYIPLFGDGFQQVILNVVNASKKSIITANKAYSDAEKMLLDSIGYYQEEKASVITVAKKSFLKSFAVTGRLDAEYYQPKYDEYLRKFDKFETTSITEEYEVFKNSGTNYADGVSDIGVIKTKQIGNDGINTDGIESYFDYDACILNKSTFLKNGDVVFASMGIGSLGKAGLFVTDKSSRYVTDSTLRIYRAKSTCRVRPEVLCIFLKSKIGQELIYRYVVGSTGMINIYDSDMEKIPIPILDDGTQKEIASKVQKHYKLCKQSKQLVQYAKQTVEIAIEQGEDVAIKWLKDKVKQTYADREKI